MIFALIVVNIAQDERGDLNPSTFPFVILVSYTYVPFRSRSQTTRNLCCTNSHINNKKHIN